MGLITVVVVSLHLTTLGILVLGTRSRSHRLSRKRIRSVAPKPTTFKLLKSSLKRGSWDVTVTRVYSSFIALL